jgi:hypothetical protein
VCLKLDTRVQIICSTELLLCAFILGRGGGTMTEFMHAFNFIRSIHCVFHEKVTYCMGKAWWLFHYDAKTITWFSILIYWHLLREFTEFTNCTAKRPATYCFSTLTILTYTTMHKKKGFSTTTSEIYFSSRLCKVFQRRWDALILHTFAHTNPALGYRHRVGSCWSFRCTCASNFGVEVKM